MRKCKLCKVELRYGNGRTGAMLNHLKEMLPKPMLAAVQLHFEFTWNGVICLIVLTENHLNVKEMFPFVTSLVGV